MFQDETTGAFHFKGDEGSVAERYIWSCLMDLSWYRIIEVIFRIVFKCPPKWVGYKNPEYYQEKSFKKLKEMASGNP